MKTITITIHDRPEYLIRLLESLVKNDLTGWDIYAAIEPTPVASEQIRLLQEFLPSCHTIINEQKLGVTHNPLEILKRVFDQENSQLNIYLEEDLIVSPDICQMADWYASIQDDSICLCLCNIGKVEIDDINSNLPHSCLFYANERMTLSGGGYGFSPLGFVTNQNNWNQHFKPNWLKDKNGWDWSVVGYVVREGKRVLLPYKTRSDHIGDWGVHVKGPEHNKRLSLGFLAVSQEDIDPSTYWIYS